MKLSLRWATGAAADLLAIRNWEDAAWLDREAERYARDGVGDARIVRAPDGRRHLVLFVPGYRVYLLPEPPARRLWVVQILRSTQ